MGHCKGGPRPPFSSFPPLASWVCRRRAALLPLLLCVRAAGLCCWGCVPVLCPRGCGPVCLAVCVCRVCRVVRSGSSALCAACCRLRVCRPSARCLACWFGAGPPLLVCLWLLACLLACSLVVLPAARSFRAQAFVGAGPSGTSRCCRVPCFFCAQAPGPAARGEGRWLLDPCPGLGAGPRFPVSGSARASGQSLALG